MEKLVCDRNQCNHHATTFCINCKCYLCKTHRAADVREQQTTGSLEHYYIEALHYSLNKQRFAPLYCIEHPNQVLISRCINCFRFSCSLCLPGWCLKSAGHYHDYDMIIDFVGSYKDDLSELCLKLQQKREIFLLQLKDACQKEDKTKSTLEELLHQIDTIVQCQIAAVTEEGKKLKEEISREMSNIIKEITVKVKSIEEKEATSQQLLHEINEVLRATCVGMAVLSYQRIKEEAVDLIKWRITHISCPTFSLSEGTDQKFLDLKLIKKEVTPIPMTDIVPPEEKKSEIIKTKCDTSDKQEYWGLSFLANDKVIAYGHDQQAKYEFTEIREGSTYNNRQSHDTHLLQLLHYGNQILMLTCDTPNNEYKISFLDTRKVLYEFKDDSPCIYSFYPLQSSKQFAVTFDHELIVLRREKNTLLVKHLETGSEREIRLSVGKKVYGVTVSSDGKLILLCDDEEKKHSVIKYDQELMKVIWMSDSLLTEDWYGDRLQVAGYKDYLYLTSHYHPKNVLRVHLSDGCVKQQIPCDALPNLVHDISLRGNVLAVAGDVEGICYFRINDITEII